MTGDELPRSVVALAAGPLKEALGRAMAPASALISDCIEQAYANGSLHFSCWCNSHRVAYVPADPAIVASHLAERSHIVGRRSLRVTLSALPTITAVPARHWPGTTPSSLPS